MSISDLVKKHDLQNQFEVLQKSYEQVEYTLNNNYALEGFDVEGIDTIVVTGLGGSAIGGELIQNVCGKELKVKYFVNRNYTMPNFVNENTLVIASSYSGNTEETISALKDALDKNAKIICISTGGEVSKIANEKQLPLVSVKIGYQPRFALWINFFTLLKILDLLNFVPDQSQFVLDIIELLKTKANEYSEEKNLALEIANKVNGFIPVIYSAADYTSAVGTRLKGQFNENSKLHAFANVIPELNHNEIIGWETFSKEQSNLILINILDDEYHPRIKNRFEITTEVIAKSGCEVIELKSEIENYKVRLFDLVYLGDWVTYYLAIIKGYDPSSIENINYLKEKLAEIKV